MLNFARSVILTALVLLVAGCASIVRDQFYNPNTASASVKFAGPPPTEVTSITADGLKLRGLWWDATEKDAPVLIFFHGRSGNQDEAAQYAEPLRLTGANVLIASYRGYGGNRGRPSESNLILDARSFLALAINRAPRSKIYLVGHSLGAAVAMGLAGSSDMSAVELIDGVFSIGGFTRLRDVAPSPVGGLLPDRFDNQSAIVKIKKPVVLIHAQDDSVVPIVQARQLLMAAPDKSLFLVFADGDHRPEMNLISQIIKVEIERGVASFDKLVKLAKVRQFGIFMKDTK